MKRKYVTIIGLFIFGAIAVNLLMILLSDPIIETQRYTGSTHVSASVDITDILDYPQLYDGYLIWRSISTYYVKDARTGIISHTGPEPGAVIEWAWTQLSSGGIIRTFGAGETWTLETSVNSQSDCVTWISDKSLTFKAKDALNTSPIDITHDNVTLIGLKVDGNEAGQTGDLSCILLNGTLYGQAIECSVSYAARKTSARGEGIEFLSSSRGGIYNCFGYYCDHDCFKIRSSTDCIVTGCIAASDNESQQSGGIQLYNSDNCTVVGNVVYGQGRTYEHGIKLHSASNNVVDGNKINNVGRMGVYLIGKNGKSNYNVISNNQITNVNQWSGEDHKGYGIYLEKHTASGDVGYNRYNLIEGNHITNCSNGIYISDIHNQVINNYIYATQNLIRVAGNYTVVTGNKIYGTKSEVEYGILLGQNICYCLVNDNHIYNVGLNSGYQAGISLYGGNCFNLIEGNHIIGITRYGIRLDSTGGVSKYNKIHGNYIHDTGSGINLYGAHEFNEVTENTIDTVSFYGIALWKGPAHTTVKGNTIRNARMDVINLNSPGVGNIFDYIFSPFSDGTELVVTAKEPWGYYVNDTNEYAVAFITIPEDCEEIIRFRIYGICEVSETHFMHIEVIAYAAALGEEYNVTEVITASNVNSYVDSIDAGDVMYWAIGDWLDSDVADLRGGDIVMLKVLYESAGGDDNATDATFLGVYVDYV